MWAGGSFDASMVDDPYNTNTNANTDTYTDRRQKQEGQGLACAAGLFAFMVYDPQSTKHNQ